MTCDPALYWPSGSVSILSVGGGLEIIFLSKPDIIVETGIAHGGSLIFYASLLSLLDLMEGIDPFESPRKVIGIDIDIRSHNLKAIKNHPLKFKIDLIEGSSIDTFIYKKVKEKIKKENKVFVSLDSNHTEDHVYEELNLYADLVSKGSYCVVFDTLIEDLPKGTFPNRPWDKGNNPKTAIEKWISKHPNFQVCNQIDNKLLISCSPKGYIKRNF